MVANTVMSNICMWFWQVLCTLSIHVQAHVHTQLQLYMYMCDAIYGSCKLVILFEYLHSLFHYHIFYTFLSRRFDTLSSLPSAPVSHMQAAA